MCKRSPEDRSRAIQYLWERAEETVATLWDRFQSGGSGCSAAKALTGIEPNSQTLVGFEKKWMDPRENLFGNSSISKTFPKKEFPHRDLSTTLRFGRDDKG
jgi:hypothetical protein